MAFIAKRKIKTWWGKFGVDEAWATFISTHETLKVRRFEICKMPPSTRMPQTWRNELEDAHSLATLSHPLATTSYRFAEPPSLRISYSVKFWRGIAHPHINWSLDWWLLGSGTRTHDGQLILVSSVQRPWSMMETRGSYILLFDRPT